MALASTAANVSTQDGSGAVVNQSNGALITMSAGGTMTVALQSTSGIGKWELQFICPNYPGLHQNKYVWQPGNFNGLFIPMPDYQVGGNQDTNALQGIVMSSTVSDASGGAPITSTYNIRTVAATGSAGQQLPHMARAVVLSALSAYTNTNGTLTENSNGAFATTDGLTIAVGDRVFLPPGIAAAATDVGIYQVTALGGASALWSMTRVSDMSQGTVIPTGTEIHVTEGTLMAGTVWATPTTGTITIGTTTQTWFPRSVTQSVTLASGTTTVTNVPLRASPYFNMYFSRTTASGTASTITYQPVGTITSGNLGTVTFAYDATVAAGTINAGDGSTGLLTIINQV